MITSMFKNAVSVKADDLLCALGLERRRRAIDHMMTASTYFLAGAIFGGFVALLLAPTTGRAFRDRMTERMRNAGERARRVAEDARERASRAGQSAYEEATSAS